MKENRRRFLTFLAGIGSIILGILLLRPLTLRRRKMEESEEEKEDQVMKDQNPTHTVDLLHNFYNSPSHELTQRYVMGFTPIVLTAAAGDADKRFAKLDEAKSLADEMYDTIEVNRHRVRAFPACVASHLLPFCQDHDAIFAGEILAEAFYFPQREIQEIVPQNLTSAITRDHYSWSHYWVPDKVLEAMLDYLSRRPSNPLFSAGSNITIQFLTYYHLSINNREVSGVLSETRKRHNKMIERAFDLVRNAKDEYSWFVKQWFHVIQQSCQTVSKTSRTYKLLPPQSSELVLGWKNCSTMAQWSQVLPCAILNNALLFHLNKEIVEGRGNPKWFQEDYGEAEAAVAMNKSVDWFKNLGLSETLFQAAISQSNDPLRTTLTQLATQTVNKGQPSPEWDPVYSLVPFRNKINPIEPPLDDLGKDWESLLQEIFGGYLVIRGGEGLYKVALQYWKSVAQHTPKQIEKEVRPTSGLFEKEMTRRDVVKIIPAIEKLTQGETKEYDHLVSMSAKRKEASPSKKAVGNKEVRKKK